MVEADKSSNQETAKETLQAPKEEAKGAAAAGNEEEPQFKKACQ